MTDTTTINLGPALDIAHAAKIQSALKALLQQDAAVEIDAQEVERIDAAGLQLLLAFVRHCTTQAREWRWLKPSTALLEAATGLGLAHSLQLSTDAHPSNVSGAQ